MSIISHKHKFIFLKTRKTAGSSIEISLARFCGADDTIVPPKEGAEFDVLPTNLRKDVNDITIRDRFALGALVLRSVVKRRPVRLEKLRDTAYSRYHERIKEHTDALLMKEAVGEEIWNSYFKFCIERNPWERLVSFYRWRSRQLSSPPDFKVFAKTALTADFQVQKEMRASHFSNWPFYTIDDVPALDYVGRFENLDQELAEIASRLGLNWDGWLPHAKSFGQPTTDYLSYYDDELRVLCGHAFAREAAMFGYSLEG